MEEYRNTVINLLVKLTRILANLLVKPTRMNPHSILGGAMGGADPPYEPSPRLYSPPGRGVHGVQSGSPSLWVPWEPHPRGKPKGQPPAGGFPLGVVLPRMAPLILGLLGFARSIPSIVTDFYRFFQTFLGEYS